MTPKFMPLKPLSGFPDYSSGKESACNLGDAGDLGLIPGSRGSPGRRDSTPSHYSILAWRILGQRSLAGYSPWGLKELDMT